MTHDELYNMYSEIIMKAATQCVSVDCGLEGEIWRSFGCVEIYYDRFF